MQPVFVKKTQQMEQIKIFLQLQKQDYSHFVQKTPDNTDKILNAQIQALSPMKHTRPLLLI